MDSNAMKIKFDKVVLDCIDPKALADFYAQLLGWKKGYVTDDFVIIGSETVHVDIGFQKNTDYVPPTWPEENGRQQQMLHLDFAVAHAELKDWVQKAVTLGAKVAGTQYSDQWTVMLDPEGHPFCFDAM
jgi:catechol-2,3-dioxygenase